MLSCHFSENLKNNFFVKDQQTAAILLFLFRYFSKPKPDYLLVIKWELKICNSMLLFSKNKSLWGFTNSRTTERLLVFSNKTSFIFNVNKYIHLDEPHDN